MRIVALEIPTFGFVVATRALLGVGIGLLLAERIPVEQRRRTGALLVGFGALATVPAIAAIRKSFRRRESAAPDPAAGRDERLIGAHRFARKGDDLGL